ncbi:hypothetical protein FS749_002704 [Ceratobasidium sp. UAMH 11750]|nr:hypothetical protein FS749_002704 [Ceratobasidium sp. UAMH 11750]
MTVSRIQRGYACIPCHTRKKRCDGARPSCGSCTRSHIECEYSEVLGEASSHRQIRNLLARVDELEDILTTMRGRGSQSPPETIVGSSGPGSGYGSWPGSDSSASPGVDPVSGEIAPWLQDILPRGASSGCVFACNLKAFTFYHAAALIDDCHRTGRSIDEHAPSKIFDNISAFIEQATSTNAWNHVNDLGMTPACILAHTATMRLYGTTLLIEERRRRAEAASAIARLSVTLTNKEIHAQPQLLERCCSEALQVLRSGGPASEVAGAREFQTLFSLIERLRQRSFNQPLGSF